MKMKTETDCPRLELTILRQAASAEDEYLLSNVFGNSSTAGKIAEVLTD